MTESMDDQAREWDRERTALLDRPISSLGLTLEGTMLERLSQRLDAELAERGLVFHPPIYLSDEWGCPDGIARIGVPFYLADERLRRLEEDLSGEVEDETESMRYLRHEAGHAFNYAYRLYDRSDWQATFGSFAEPYSDSYFPDPFSTSHVRHVLGWYAQKHPDEDFAETFAVWLTPNTNWRAAYEGWGALEKLEYVDRIMAEVGSSVSVIPDASEEDADVGDLHHTLAEHYHPLGDALPMPHRAQFDADLLRILPDVSSQDVPAGGAAFLRVHQRQLVSRIALWSGESTTTVRTLANRLADRADELHLAAPSDAAGALIAFTAFIMGVIMHWRIER
ncbi:MAG: hypothetical protein ABI884_03935 [Gemmatimonadota bacterium]